MSDPHLILHKVCGEPAFDIAEKIEFDDGEEGWIIPTSGHRAYPCWNMSLEAIKSYLPEDQFMWWAPPTVPSGLPDHYTVRAPAKLTGLLEKLGLKKPTTNLAVRGF